jgi:hypothetical protein
MTFCSGKSIISRRKASIANGEARRYAPSPPKKVAISDQGQVGPTGQRVTLPLIDW